MIRTEINIETPQKVEIIEIGIKGWILYSYKGENKLSVHNRSGEWFGDFKPEELRPLEDEKLVFDVNSFDVLEAGTSFWIHGHLEGEVSSDTIYIKLGFKELNLNEYTFQVIATPKKEKSLEDMTKEELIEMVKQLKK